MSDDTQPPTPAEDFAAQVLALRAVLGPTLEALAPDHDRAAMALACIYMASEQLIADHRPPATVLELAELVAGRFAMQPAQAAAAVAALEDGPHEPVAIAPAPAPPAAAPVRMVAPSSSVAPSVAPSSSAPDVDELAPPDSAPRPTSTIVFDDDEPAERIVPCGQCEGAGGDCLTCGGDGELVELHTHTGPMHYRKKEPVSLKPHG